MNRLLNYLVWILAGALLLLSVWLSQVISRWWLLLTLLVGAYLVVSGITGSCLVKNYLRKHLGEAAGDDDDED
jgi:hypothetical protein